MTGAKFTPDREGCACVICGAWRSGHAPDGRCLPPPVAPPKRAATVKAAQRAVARYLAEVEVELDDQGREVELPRTPPLPSGIVRALLLAFEDRADPKRGRAAAWAVVRAVLGAALVLALAACGGGSTSTVDACHENSDCAAGLVCALGACREPCATSADCAAGWTCAAMACVPPSSGSTDGGDGASGSTASSGASSGSPSSSGTATSSGSSSEPPSTGYCCNPPFGSACLTSIVPCGMKLGNSPQWNCGGASESACGSCTLGASCTFEGPMTSSGSGALATCTGTVSACPTGCTGAGGVATCP